jgi:hypothetical protein
VKTQRIFLLFCALALGISPSARASLEITMNPSDSIPGGGSYVSATTNISIPGSEFDILNSVSDGKLSVGFSIPMQVLDVGSGWGSWSSPPFSESSTPTVLWTQGPTQVTLTLSQPVQTFGFELQPDQFGLFSTTAIFFSGTNQIGTIVESVDGNAGARLFAGTVTGSTPLITSVLVSIAGTDFAIAEPSYALPGQTVVVPEPSTLGVALISVLLACGFASYRYRRRNAA